MKPGRVALAALVAEVTAIALLWGRLPERMAMHWNLAGEANGFGSRLEVCLLGPALLIGLWAVLALVSRIDPKASVPLPADAPPAEQGARDTLVAMVLAMLGLLHVGTLLSSAGLLSAGPRLHALWIAAFMLVMGNVLGRVRPNFFVGIRTPWTLSDDQVWRRTHRASGRLLFAGGLVAAVLGALLPERLVFGAAIVLLATCVAIPAVLSYFWWRGLHRDL